MSGPAWAIVSLGEGEKQRRRRNPTDVWGERWKLRRGMMVESTDSNVAELHSWTPDLVRANRPTESGALIDIHVWLAVPGGYLLPPGSRVLKGSMALD